MGLFNALRWPLINRYYKEPKKHLNKKFKYTSKRQHPLKIPFGCIKIFNPKYFTFLVGLSSLDRAVM